MMLAAAGHLELARSTSFIQVEYGKNELLALWDAFVDSSDDFDLDFKSRKHICKEFARALNAYIDDEEPSLNKVGY
jgi:hypothetical protein